jgi:hypothetical protein
VQHIQEDTYVFAKYHRCKRLFSWSLGSRFSPKIQTFSAKMLKWFLFVVTQMLWFKFTALKCLPWLGEFICGNNGQGRSWITFIWSFKFKSQINTNSAQRGTPAFITNKWADLLGWGGADPIQVKTRISNNFIWRQKIGGKVQWTKKKCGINEHDKMIQYFPHITSTPVISMYCGMPVRL